MSSVGIIGVHTISGHSLIQRSVRSHRAAEAWTSTALCDPYNLAALTITLPEQTVHRRHMIYRAVQNAPPALHYGRQRAVQDALPG